MFTANTFSNIYDGGWNVPAECHLQSVCICSTFSMHYDETHLYFYIYFQGGKTGTMLYFNWYPIENKNNCLINVC